MKGHFTQDDLPTLISLPVVCFDMSQIHTCLFTMISDSFSPEMHVAKQTHELITFVIVTHNKMDLPLVTMYTHV